MRPPVSPLPAGAPFFDIIERPIMALFFADLVREASWGEGAGALALGGPLPGHRAFAATVPAGARFHYAIRSVTRPEEWETGEGELAGGALVRAPISSSAGGAAVDLSAGLKTVALTVNADWFAARDGGVAAIGDVDGLIEALAAKAPLAHGHSFAGLSGRPTTLAGYGIIDAAASDHDHDGDYQPLDGGLTAIAGLATTGFGRGHLALTDATALRGHAGLGTLATQNASDVNITGGLITMNFGSGSFSAGVGKGYTDASLGLVISAHTGSVFDLFLASRAGNALLTSPADTSIVELANATAVVTPGAGLSVNGNIAIGGSQVVASRRTGWTAPSGTASRAGFDTASVTTEALAQRLKALIDDLAAHGLIGG